MAAVNILWMGGDAASTQNPEKRALLNCEDQWTRHAKVILNPPSNEPVDTTPMFTPPTTCQAAATTPNPPQQQMIMAMRPITGPRSPMISGPTIHLRGSCAC